MASMRKSYFLAPSWDVKPSEVTLGSVISNPKTPQRILSEAGLTANIDGQIPQPTEEQECSGLAKKSGEWSLGLFAKFLQVILGGEISFTSSSALEVEYSCDSIQTHRFTPSMAYIAQAAEDPNVREFLKMGGLGAKVFMVTGVKIANNLTVTTVEEKGKELSGQIGGSIPAASINVGPKGSHKSSAYGKHTQKIAGPTVFAFQLEKIRLNRNNKVTSSEFIEGAMLGLEEDGGAEDFVIERAGQGLDEDEMDDFGFVSQLGIDEDGDGCDIFAVSD